MTSLYVESVGHHRFIHGILMVACLLSIGCEDIAPNGIETTPKALTLKRGFASVHVTDDFGSSLSASKDGSVVVVGAQGDTLVCTDKGELLDMTDDISQCTAGTIASGLVYVYHPNDHKVWLLKPTQAQTVPSMFGASVALSSDGLLLAVGAPHDSQTHNTTPTDCANIIRAADWPTKCNADASDATMPGFQAGAVYVYAYANATWSLQYLVRQEHAGTIGMNGYRFGQKLMWSDDNTTLVVGMPADQNDISTFKQPPTKGFKTPAQGSVYVYQYDQGMLSFDHYFQQSGAVGLGKHMHATTKGVVVNSDEAVMTVNLKNFNANGVTVLSGLPTFPAGVTISEAILQGNRLAVGLPLLNSDCVGVVSLPDPERHADLCLNADGANDNVSGPETGGVMVFQVHNHHVTPQALIKYPMNRAQHQIGMSLLMSADNQTLFFGMHDDNHCVGTHTTRALCASNQDNSQAQVSNVGAIGQYTLTGTRWSETGYVKAPDSIPEAAMGAMGTVFRAGDHLYFTLNHPNSCQGIQDLREPIVCLQVAGYRGVILQYALSN